MTKIMKQPQEPRQEDCCNSGCTPCIFDVYEKQLKLYQKYLNTGETDKGKENSISQLSYTTFVLKNKTKVCDSHMLLHFKQPNGSKVWWNPGDHFLVKYSIGGSHCTKAYTPLWLDDECDEHDEFMILVKKYNDGKVSKYLYSLEVGSDSLWRGPYGSYSITPNKFKRIIMIAQGTGIAPFISIINEILHNEDDMTKITLYYCCRNKDCIPLRETLYAYKSYWNFSYQIFLKEPADEKFFKYKEPITNCRLNLDHIGPIKPSTDNDNFLLCGSKEFCEYFKNCLQDNYGLQENLIIF